MNNYPYTGHPNARFALRHFSFQTEDGTCYLCCDNERVFGLGARNSYIIWEHHLRQIQPIPREFVPDLVEMVMWLKVKTNNFKRAYTKNVYTE